VRLAALPKVSESYGAGTGEGCADGCCAPDLAAVNVATPISLAIADRRHEL
jgi:hypothetical protein